MKNNIIKIYILSIIITEVAIATIFGIDSLFLKLVLGINMVISILLSYVFKNDVYLNSSSNWFYVNLGSCVCYLCYYLRSAL